MRLDGVDVGGGVQGGAVEQFGGGVARRPGGEAAARQALPLGERLQQDGLAQFATAFGKLLELTA